MGEKKGFDLPACAEQYIAEVVRKMRYRRLAHEEVRAELAAHFEDELTDCTDAQEREQRARRLIEGFGDPKLLAILCRRAKKRCRPLWAKAVVRSLQAAVVFIVLLDLYVVWFISGRPNVEVDYFALLNQIGRPEVVERDNAWPHFERAMALAAPDYELRGIPAYDYPDYAEHRELAALTEDVQGAIAKWLEANQPAWDEFVLAGSKPHFAESYKCSENASEPWLVHVRLSELTVLHQLSKAGIWLSRLRIRQGQTAEALEACLALARAGRHWQHARVLVEQMVGMGMSRRAHEEILAILGRQQLSLAELAGFQRELAAVYPQPYPWIAIEDQRLIFLDTVQRFFTDGGPGGGHLVPSKVGDFVSAMGGGEEQTLGRAAAFIHAGRDETLAKAREIFDLQEKFATMSPYDRRAVAATREDLAFISQPQRRYALVQMLLSSLDRPADLAFRGKALHEATLTVVALLRHRLEKGSYPAVLAELKQGGYLDTLPADPYGSGLLVYKATGDDFVLYSLGPDFDDDDGKPGRDGEGRPQMWADNGDTVFWPVGP